ncbi:hypothetical protein CORC01_00072 [Colletotrichum orchidophilum]|uniref:Chromo domain-containing protein n=1 Tax=Colletotrichum orchidophilum TaxID=1209926 RepID=A0A1G4BT83_9PEZI|nr:uncharacterized protein CORC01_00072 [Colletotrichum orchidophilum]OHF04601.1 hypothetical protein CORC01_00072 [Colletotrichum orchidophilum]
MTVAEWELLDISNHAVEASDPTRIMLQCLWNTKENSITWEPECVIQEDAPLVQEAYVTINNHRNIIQTHTFISDNKKADKGADAIMSVSWVESMEVIDVLESLSRRTAPYC